MAVKFSNNARTNLSSAILSTATSITVDDASVFPTLGASDHTFVTFESLDVSPTREIVKVTAIDTSTDTLTVVRGQDGTTAAAFSSGAKVELRLTAALLNAVADDADTESVSIAGDTMTGSLTTPGLTVSGSQTTQLNGSDSTLGSNFDVHLLAGSSGGGVRLGTNSSTNDSFIATTGTNDFKLVTYNGSSWGNRITLDNLGNFGVGQNTPQQILHVSNGGLQIDGYVTTPASGQTGVLIDYYSGASRFWSRGTASARGSFSFIQLENDGQNQQTALGIDTSGNATFAGNVVVGSSSTAKNLRVYFSDGSHATLLGYGLEMSRSSSYVRPTTDGTQVLYLGGGDASLDWATVAVKSTNGISMNGSIFIDGSRNLNNIGTISSGAITTTGKFLQQGPSSISNSTAYFSTYAYGSGQGDNRTHFGYYNSANSTYTNYIRGTSTLFSHGVTIQGDISTTGSSITVDPASGDAALLLQGAAGAQTLRIDQNSIRTTTNSPISIMTNSALALTIDTSQNITVAGNLTLESGTNGTTDKIILKTSDNADLNKFIRTNAYYVEFGGHANEGFKFVDTNNNTLLALYGGNNALAKQAVFAGKVSASTNYSYSGLNYHFILKEDTQDSYIGNINGTVLLTAGGYYYGSALRQMNSGSTAYSALQLHPTGVIEMEQITGATAGGTATRNIRFKIETDGSGLFTGNLKTQGTFHANYSELGRSIRSANRGELHLNATGTNDVSEIFFGYGDGFAGNDNKLRWVISDRGTSADSLVFYRGPGLTGNAFYESAYLNSSGLTVNGDVTANNYNGHKLSNSEWGMTLGTYMTADITGQKISKHTSNSSWNGEVRSTLGLQRSAEARVIPNQTDKYFMFGLNTDPTTDTSFGSIDYAFYCQANGNLSAYENGTSVSLGLTYAAGDDLRVVLEKPYIRYIKNDAVVRTVKAGSSPFATGDETFYFDSSFHSAGNDLTRLIHFGPARTLGLEGRPLEKFNSTGRYFLGNNDWSDIPTAINPSNFAYNAASKGMEVTGGSAQLFIPCRIPIDPDASYRIRVRMMKVSGAGSFYVGVQTLTEDFVNIATDPFNSYNYGVASNQTPSVGAETEYEGIFSGYNTTSGGSSTAFDPDGKYFNLYILCNYQGSGTTVIRSVEIERYDPEPLVYGLRKINSDPIVINSNQLASHALRVYYDMSVYNTVNFTDSNWSTQGKIDGVSNGLRYHGDSHKWYTKDSSAMYHYSSRSSHYLHSGTGSNDWEVGRDGSQKLRIYVDDHHINLQGWQDDDSNAEHNFVIDRYFSGTGGNNFVVRKDGSNQMYIDTDGIINYYTFRAFDADATPAGTVFANTVKGKNNYRTIYFDGDGTSVSTWYGVGNNPFSAIDCTDGVMDFWINNSSGTWRNIAHVDEDGLHVTYGGFYLDNSASIQAGSRISFLNGGNAQGIAVASVYAGTSYSNSAPSGMVGTLNGYQVGNQTIIDSTGSHVGHGTNYATDKGWVKGDPLSNQTGYYGGNFTLNGGSTENAIITTDLPGGGVGKVWASYQNDSNSGADGGWNKTITGLDDESSYISIVYVRRYSTGTSGSFYHGCSGSTTLNMDGSANTNPYFSSFGISNIPYNVWCVSIGFIHGNSAPNSQSWLGGLYNCETGEQISAYYDFKMKDGATTQLHRTYLYYSTGSAYLQWAKPGFYRIDGTEPSIADLIRPNPEYAMRVSDNLVVGRIYGGSYTYMGLRHKDMTGSSDAMIKSTGDHTVVTAKNGYSVKIRGGGDNSSNEILVPDSTYIQVDTDNFNVEGNVNANASSDRRLKHSLRRIENPLDKLRQITGFHFEWDDRHVRKMSGDGQIEFRKDDVGVIAQDVQKVLDECVVERKDGYLGVRYDRLIPLCIEGLKEADAKIQEQQRQIDQLTELVKELTNGNN